MSEIQPIFTVKVAKMLDKGIEHPSFGIVLNPPETTLYFIGIIFLLVLKWSNLAFI